jgi:DNA (cytosine-5)-methyltransferase 1
MENVPNLLLLQKGHFRDLIVRAFRSCGYDNTTFVTASAADYGVPQLRRRVFFIGTRDDLNFPFELRDFLTAALERQRIAQPFTVWDALSDLPAGVVASGTVLRYPRAAKLSKFQKMMRLDFDAPPYTKKAKRERGIGAGPVKLHNHHTKEIQERRKHLISLLRPGEKGDSLPKAVWNGLRPEKWRRLDPDSPSYTILAQMHRDLSEWVHPTLERWITVREAARLQSFHDGFVFVGSEWQQLKQIGNAVPPLLGYALGQAAVSVLQRLNTQRKRTGTAAAIQAVLPYAAAASS